MSTPDLTAVVEAILFVGGPPVAVERICQVLRGVDPEQVAEAVAELNRRYRRQRRPYEIRLAPGGYQMALRTRYASYLARLTARSRTVRLSQAAIEVLALVAYRQPITAQEIDAIRGSDSSGVLRQLRRRNLVATTSEPEGASKVPKYVTTQRFAELFQLQDLADLLKLQDLQF
jgi:segregation and condensation protein B